MRVLFAPLLTFEWLQVEGGGGGCADVMGRGNWQTASVRVAIRGAGAEPVAAWTLHVSPQRSKKGDG